MRPLSHHPERQKLSVTGPSFPANLDHLSPLELLDFYHMKAGVGPSADRYAAMKQLITLMARLELCQQQIQTKKIIELSRELTNDDFERLGAKLINRSMTPYEDATLDQTQAYVRSITQHLMAESRQRSSQVQLRTCLQLSALNRHHPGLMDDLLIQQTLGIIDDAPAEKSVLIPLAAKLIWNLSTDNSLRYATALYARIPDREPDNIPVLQALADITEFLPAQPGSQDFIVKIRQHLYRALINQEAAEAQ